MLLSDRLNELIDSDVDAQITRREQSRLRPALVLAVAPDVSARIMSSVQSK